MSHHHRETLSAEALNDAIRTLWVRAGEQQRSLTADEQRIYQVLVTAWAEATPPEQRLAA
ncbi:hypothetical protein [Streptomyces sp. NBC_00691]|uniref:hypothetical protein n=1 Tax=Streptomyces sp. NBC_00691 TaxID=2903671 RepID=UPI002E327B01|nr:hypothetical protein [Streptomyces sp. NBC_00691]